MPDDRMIEEDCPDEVCPVCGHSIDGCHDEFNVCYHDDHGDLDNEDPCPFIYNVEGVAVRA